MLITTVISGLPLLTSHGHVTSLLRFIMVLVNDTENASYFCQYIKNFCLFVVFYSLQNRYLKYIIKILKYFYLLFLYFATCH